MNILVIDGQGGQLGSQLIKEISRLFKKITGISPSDYRKLYR